MMSTNSWFYKLLFVVVEPCVEVRHVEERLEHGISHLQKTINEYQDALGLKMNIVDDGHIRFTFACIDPQKPQVKYIVEVGREGTDKLIGKTS